MKFGESEVLGIIDDNGIDIGHVYAILYYRSAEQYVIIMGREVQNGLLKLLGRHLAMGRDDAEIRHESEQLAPQYVKILYTVRDDEDLTAS